MEIKKFMAKVWYEKDLKGENKESWSVNAWDRK